MTEFLPAFTALSGISGCTGRESGADLPVIAVDDGPFDIWSNHITGPDTVLTVSRLTVEASDTLGACHLGYAGVPRGFVTADPAGFILSDIGFATPLPEARAYGWDLALQWTFVDSSPPAPFHPLLGRACTYADSQVLLSTSAGGGMLYLLDREDGALEGTIVLSGILPDSESGGYCAVALPSEDLVLLVDTCGEVARTITCGHGAARSFLTPSAAGPNVTVVNPVIADIQAGTAGRLWVLFGPGAFPTDSSEIWAIDLGSMEASVLPLSSLATGFGVWGDRVVIQTRGRDRNMETDSWSDPENRILVLQLKEGG